MKKTFIAVAFSLIGLSLPTEAGAAIVTIHENGFATWNILSLEDERQTSGRESLKVSNIASKENYDSNTRVYLKNDDGKVELSFISGTRETEIDLTGFTQNIIEIEEKKIPQRVSIFMKDDTFVIAQNDVEATTSFPITIIAKNKEISVKTPTGFKFVSIFPFEAITDAVNANLISESDGETRMELVEDESGEIAYLINGKKSVNIFNLYELATPVSAVISASNGKVISTNEPVWFTLLGFLFA